LQAATREYDWDRENQIWGHVERFNGDRASDEEDEGIKELNTRRKFLVDFNPFLNPQNVSMEILKSDFYLRAREREFVRYKNLNLNKLNIDEFNAAIPLTQVSRNIFVP